MHLLTLDTSTEACSVALQTDEKIFERYEVAPRQHAKLILAMVDDLLAEAKVKLSEFDAIGFGCGPGSFTGVRIAASVTQGLGLALNCPVVPISSLAILAQMAIEEVETDLPILAAIDARMNEIYWGSYKNQDGLAVLVGREQVTEPDLIALCDRETKHIAIGSGATHYEDELSRHLGLQIKLTQDAYPRAKFMLPLAKAQLEAGNAVSAEQALPVYVRNSVAEKMVK